MIRPLPALTVALALFATHPIAARADTCTSKDFADAVDQSGASLRTLTLEAQPKLEERMRRYRDARKLTDGDYRNLALDAIEDEKLRSYDAQSSELMLKVNSLGRVPEGAQPDCSKLGDVRAASSELSVVIKQKSDYMMSRLDALIAEADAGGARTADAKPEQKADPGAETKSEPSAEATPELKAGPKPAQRAETKPEPKPGAKPDQKPKRPQDIASSSETKPARPKPHVAPPPPSAPAERTAEAQPNDAYRPPPVGDEATLDLPPPNEGEGYSIDEIREATRGFFGTISTNLASVLEHAFKQAGRPTAYVLGSEGGASFLAGLRFGKGTLYMRNHPETRDVYWHGPSIGTDFGASGSRTMFLIYRMHEPAALYRNFTGVDGSAYFVGGVGLTLLKGGQVIMAPIRSGVGLRFGANLGYVRFTPRPTWNPF